MVIERQIRKAFISAAARRARILAQYVRLKTNHEQTARVAFAVLMWMAASSTSTAHPAQSSPSAPLDLQITQVSRLAAVGHGATADVEIRWTVKVPRFTTMDAFDVLLEVHYSDGSRGTARSESLKSTTRSAILQVAEHPKANSAATLKAFHASIRARFKVASSLTVVQQVVAKGSSNLRSGSASAGQPEVFITEAKLVPGCAANRECLDVRWTASAPRPIAIEGFTINVDALHKNGAHSLDSKTASAADRQARLALDSAGSEITSIKVALNTDFSTFDSRTVVREGAF